MPYKVRPARPSDAHHISDLIYSAYKSYAHHLCGSSEKSTVLERLKILFSHHTVSVVHHSHATVLEEVATSHIVGIASCLRGEYIPFYYLNLVEVLAQISYEEDEYLLRSIRDFVSVRAAYENEYHLDILAIREDLRGKGLVNFLLAEVYKRAALTELPYISLLATDNLVEFYKTKGFDTFRELVDGSMTYHLMYKKLENIPEKVKII